MSLKKIHMIDQKKFSYSNMKLDVIVQREVNATLMLL